MPAQEEVHKVAVLGGGPAGIAAAFELSAPEHEGRYEVTVYQPGWRLGGKCASGRNMAPGRGGRIEEHGLHIWFGFYENAFGLMRRAYSELARPAGHPLATFEEAFKGCDEIVLYDRQGAGWVELPFNAPKNLLVPGETHALPTFWDIANWLCEWAKREFDRFTADARAAGAQSVSTPLDRVRTYLEAGPAAAGVAHESLLELSHALASHAQAHGTERLPREPLRKTHAFAGLKLCLSPEKALVEMLGVFRDWVWHEFGTECDADAHLRLLFTMFDTFVSAAKGIVDDQVLEQGWEAINGEELCDWLRRHGAHTVTVGASPEERSPLLRSIYDVAFGYLEGDIDKPNVAAGTAINDFLRLSFSYRGSLMYKMQAGMGDTVLTPFYEVLKARGVKFKFFHSITRLHLTPEGGRLRSVDLVEQVQLGEQEYEPLVTVRGLECWPSEPLWQQLPEGEQLKQREPDFEGQADPLGRGEQQLIAGRDFDSAVLAIPVGALGPICEELAERDPRFAQMLRAAVTVPTQAFQLWLTQTPQALGWPRGQNSVAGCFAEPLDTWCDMAQLLEREQWSATAVPGLVYFCGVLDAQPETQALATERVKRRAVEFLESHAATLWHDAANHAGGFRWELLHDPDDRPGPARFDAQYWRANVSGSERYVLTPAGSVQSRLAAGESGVDNLYLAGDWTRNGIDGGCVEAAMTSGIQAALALAGIERSLPGEDPRWLSSQERGPLALPAALGGGPALAVAQPAAQPQ